MVLTQRARASALLQEATRRGIKRSDDAAGLHHVVHTLVQQRRRNVRDVLLKAPANRAWLELPSRVSRANGDRPPLANAIRPHCIPFLFDDELVIVFVYPAEVLPEVRIATKLRQ